MHQTNLKFDFVSLSSSKTMYFAFKYSPTNVKIKCSIITKLIQSYMIIIKHNYNNEGIDITLMKEKVVGTTRRVDEENGSEI